MYSIIEPNLTDLSESVLKIWQRVNQFNKFQFQRKNVRVGDLVFLIEDNMPVFIWPLGRITKIYSGSDTLIRVLKVETQNGKGTTFHEDYEDYGVSTKSVMTLNHELKNKGYTLTTDKYYTSPELAEILIKSKTDIYGTLRENRKGLPPLIKSSKVKKGVVLAFQNGKICLLKWTDKKPIHMLSILHSTSMVTVESKKSKSSKLKPAVMADYNNTMGGVDKADQCLSYYPVARNQQRKYYKKIFRYLLSQAVWNAFVIFKKNGGKMRQVEFRMKLIERLIEVTVCNPSTRRGPFPKSEENVVRLTGRHFPSYVDESESRKKSRKCVVCSLKINENGKRVRRESRFECKSCNVGLCVAPCFEIYHTESNL
ncbi:PiggyBac transposable element-derived protein 4 [Araneus ventricosus]|uniref:PiggyBac transposable element-derived protein 4 n=1 Tax=Araneus ventricosus TaxID=182803 RepID=A0A4Y2CWT7_ARAVE|nr:PiggyBac transposable element-derived protein 4 [Araneus ventricosus]